MIENNFPFGMEKRKLPIILCSKFMHYLKKKKKKAQLHHVAEMVGRLCVSTCVCVCYRNNISCFDVEAGQVVVVAVIF